MSWVQLPHGLHVVCSESVMLTLRRLQHKFEVELKDGTKQTRLSTLCEYGNPAGYSAMAKLGEYSHSEG